MKVKLLACAVLFVAGTACHEMRTVQPTQLVSTGFNPVWVTSTDKNTVILHAPHVSGDTLAGFIDGKYQEMLLSNTQTIKARTSAPGRTAVLASVTGATVLGLFIYMANRTYVGDGQTCYTPKDGTPIPCCAGKSTVAC